MATARPNSSRFWRGRFGFNIIAMLLLTQMINEAGVRGEGMPTLAPLSSTEMVKSNLEPRFIVRSVVAPEPISRMRDRSRSDMFADVMEILGTVDHQQNYFYQSPSSKEAEVLAESRLLTDTITADNFAGNAPSSLSITANEFALDTILSEALGLNNDSIIQAVVNLKHSPEAMVSGVEASLLQTSVIPLATIAPEPSSIWVLIVMVGAWGVARGRLILGHKLKKAGRIHVVFWQHQWHRIMRGWKMDRLR